MQDSKKERSEHDSMGSIEIPLGKHWGAQTQRSLAYFSMGEDHIPPSFIIALGIIKKAAALANNLPPEKKHWILQAADEVIAGKLFAHFPLYVWQSGGGTHTNMNANEVIAHRAIELSGGTSGPIHPNDHVNMSQSSNDVFPTAMHIAAAMEITHTLLPKVQKMKDALASKAKSFEKIIKIGRTHLMDAVPLTLGQEFSGYAEQLDANIERLKLARKELYALALGGTAVGTGLNAAPDFANKAIASIAEFTKLPFFSAPNKFAALSCHDSLLFASGALKTLAVSLTKIANDIRWMGSGPRCGLGELLLPQNEPGSSIMPGKVNPTQCEAMLMIASQVIGNDVTITTACSQGNFEINNLKPVIIFNFLHSVRLLADTCNNFTDFLLIDLKANEKKIEYFLERSLMRITALSPIIGYDKCAHIVKLAIDEDLTLKEACLKLGFLSADDFDKHTDPKNALFD